MRKIAEKHLDPCEIAECKYAHSIHKGEPQVCCFALRATGCFYFDQEVQDICEDLLETVNSMLDTYKLSSRTQCMSNNW